MFRVLQQIHRQSKRSGQPFIAIDCGALSKELASSELFGHEKGSFTGALNQKIGNFELANGGTIFLDEIANLSYEVQVSLLRVVQERKMRRVGGNKDINLDVRIIVASNEKLFEAAQKGKFREDLYHRFNEFSIHVPPFWQTTAAQSPSPAASPADPSPAASLAAPASSEPLEPPESQPTTAQATTTPHQNPRIRSRKRE